MIVLSSNLRTIASSDGAAILDLDSNQIMTLNSTGGLIWSRLCEGHAVSEIIRSIAAESDTDVEIVKNEVLAFVDDLKEHKLLSVLPTNEP
jgi:hypothetical protein